MKNGIKTYIFSVLCVGSLLFVTSCGSANENTNVSLATQENIELKGQLVHPTPPAETDFLLKTDDGKEIAVASTLISLERYFDKFVNVSGYYKNEEKTIFEVLSIDDNVNTNGNQNGFSETGVQTYANNTLGVRFQYPSSWVMKEKDQTKVSAVTKENGESIMEIFRIIPKVNQTLSNWIGVNYKNAEVLETEFGGVSGMRVATDDSNEEIILLTKNNYFYSIHFKYNGKELDQNLVIRQFAELENTFEFFVPGTLPVTPNNNENTEDSSFSTTSVMTGANPSGEEVSLPDYNANQNRSSGSTSTTTNLNQNKVSSTSSDSSSSHPSTSTEATSITASTPQQTPSPSILSYLKQNSYLLPQGTDVSAVSKLEIAAGKYVYVTYQDGENTKKVAYSYTDNGDGTFSVAEQGLFQIDPATSKWTTLNGANPAPNSNREIYAIGSQGTAEKTADVSEGKNLYTNDRTGVKVEYPNNWYYQGSSLSEKGGLQQVVFSSKPLDESPEDQVTLKVYTAAGMDLSDASQATVGGISAYKVTGSDGNTEYAVKGSDGKVYVTSGGSSEHMAEILKSVSK